jgi:hypothetical protein
MKKPGPSVNPTIQEEIGLVTADVTVDNHSPIGEGVIRTQIQTKPGELSQS